MRLNTILEQLWHLRRLLLFGFVPPVLLLLLLAFQRSVPLKDLTSDTAAVSDLPTYVGLLSNLGFLLWSAAITTCMLTALVLWRRSTWVWFFLVSAGFTTVLLVDDMFMIHERVLPALGIDERAYYVFYPLLIVMYAVVYWRQLRQTDYALLLITLALLGGSAAVDFSYEKILSVYNSITTEPTAQVEDESLIMSPPDIEVTATPSPPRAVEVTLTDYLYLLEDGMKFMGIISWLMYLIATARAHIVNCFYPTTELKRVDNT
jgi:hypothetical protein